MSFVKKKKKTRENRRARGRPVKIDFSPVARGGKEEEEEERRTRKLIVI